jgi:HPt (histidine-containing phosphotransfer) domain-containing protein
VDLISDYLTTGEQLLQKAQSGLNERNGSQLRYAAHTLKGASHGLGLLDLANLARELEQLATKTEWVEAEEKLNSLVHLFLNAQPVLTKLKARLKSK